MAHKWIEELTEEEKKIVAQLMADAYTDGMLCSRQVLQGSSINMVFENSVTNVKIKLLFDKSMIFSK